MEKLLTNFTNDEFQTDILTDTTLNFFDNLFFFLLDELFQEKDKSLCHQSD